MKKLQEQMLPLKKKVQPPKSAQKYQRKWRINHKYEFPGILNISLSKAEMATGLVEVYKVQRKLGPGWSDWETIATYRRKAFARLNCTLRNEEVHPRVLYRVQTGYIAFDPEEYKEQKAAAFKIKNKHIWDKLNVTSSQDKEFI